MGDFGLLKCLYQESYNRGVGHLSVWCISVDWCILLYTVKKIKQIWVLKLTFLHWSVIPHEFCIKRFLFLPSNYISGLTFFSDFDTFLNTRQKVFFSFFDTDISGGWMSHSYRNHSININSAFQLFLHGGGAWGLICSQIDSLSIVSWFDVTVSKFTHKCQVLQQSFLHWTFGEASAFFIISKRF